MAWPGKRKDADKDDHQPDNKEHAEADPLSGDAKTQIGLGTPEGRAHAKWLSEQLGGYTNWYYKDGTKWFYLGSVFQVAAVLTGLTATILAAGPQNLFGEGNEDRWIIASFSAITTAISGALPSILKLARDREEGRIEMVRLRQELDVLQGGPPLTVYLAAKAAIDRIAAIERGYGGTGSGK